jgi:hypothetical protein
VFRASGEEWGEEAELWRGVEEVRGAAELGCAIYRAGRGAPRQRRGSNGRRC